MPRTVMTEQPTKDAARYLRHWSIPGFVHEQITALHKGLPPERRRAKAKQSAFCIGQALEYLESGSTSSLLTKALPLFYAAENSAKAACIIRDPSLTAADFRAHGLKSDQSRRYSIKNLRCAVYANPGADAWSHLFRNCNADIIQISHTENGQAMVTDRRSVYATAPLSRKTLELGHVLRHLPELAEDVVFAGWGHPYVVRAENLTLMSAQGPPASRSCSFMLRHNHHSATKAMIVDRESDLLKQYTRGLDVLDVIQYTATVNPPPDLVLPVIRLDVFGEPFMDFRRTAVVLGELCLYFVALFILSSIVRYDAGQWKRLLDDHPAEGILIDRFLDLAIRKLPNLVLNELQGQAVLFRFAR